MKNIPSQYANLINSSKYNINNTQWLLARQAFIQSVCYSHLSICLSVCRFYDTLNILYIDYLN